MTENDRQVSAAPMYFPEPRSGRDFLSVSIVEDGPGRVIITLVGEVDMHTVPRLDTVLRNLDPATTRIIIDLTGVDFLGSAGLKALVSAQRAAERTRAKLALVASGPTVHRPLDVTGLTDMFEMHPDLAQARASSPPAARPH